MGARTRLGRFGRGGLLGAGIGTSLAVLFAPRSGDELRGRIFDRLRLARLAGAEAKAAKENELIRKFRESIDDPDALADEANQVRLEAAQAVAAIGLGLNAPGALAAQESLLRANAHLAAEVDNGEPDRRAPQAIAATEAQAKPMPAEELEVAARPDR